jgi:hypothetical protein
MAWAFHAGRRRRPAFYVNVNFNDVAGPNRPLQAQKPAGTAIR